jgi:hypothetical protein
MHKLITAEKTIRAIVSSHLQTFAEKHISEFNDPEGTINLKIHNIFLSVLNKDIQFYSSLSRSFDSSLGNVIENMAISIAKLFYEVTHTIEGNISDKQIQLISELLEKYTRNVKRPEIKDYTAIRNTKTNSKKIFKRKSTDYCLFDKDKNEFHLIELKIGGDLDNKKARSEKEAILEQYAILSNKISKKIKINIHFATAYNRYGEGKEWKQTRVLQFFSKEELLIGKDFWNFICKSDQGFNIVIDEYKKNSHFIVESLKKIKNKYLR